MLIIPAIDLMQGRVVRLYQGRPEQSKVYSNDAVSIAKTWQEEGARLLHVVDLDAAIWGKLQNIEILEQIIRNVDIPVEFGGGIRQEEDLKMVLELGVERVVLGTVALTQRQLFEKLIHGNQDKIIVSIDMRDDGKLAIKGWARNKAAEVGLVEFIKSLCELGIERIIYTDIDRDGTLKGPRIELLKNRLAVLSSYKIKAIMAGGVSSLEDIKQLSTLQAQGLEGVIIGKALYEKKFTLKEAMSV